MDASEVSKLLFERRLILDIQTTFRSQKLHCKKSRWTYIKNESRKSYLGNKDKKAHFGFASLQVELRTRNTELDELNLTSPASFIELVTHSYANKKTIRL